MKGNHHKYDMATWQFQLCFSFFFLSFFQMSVSLHLLLFLLFKPQLFLFCRSCLLFLLSLYFQLHFLLGFQHLLCFLTYNRRVREFLALVVP